MKQVVTSFQFRVLLSWQADSLTADLLQLLLPLTMAADYDCCVCASEADCSSCVVGEQAVREAFLVQDALKAVVTLVAEPLGRHPDMSDRVSMRPVNEP